MHNEYRLRSLWIPHSRHSISSQADAFDRDFDQASAFVGCRSNPMSVLVALPATGHGSRVHPFKNKTNSTVGKDTKTTKKHNTDTPHNATTVVSTSVRPGNGSYLSSRTKSPLPASLCLATPQSLNNTQPIRLCRRRPPTNMDAHNAVLLTKWTAAHHSPLPLIRTYCTKFPGQRVDSSAPPPNRKPHVFQKILAMIHQWQFHLRFPNIIW